MQNIPDSLRGFQPDMDPDLREVLVALEEEEEVPEEETRGESDGEDPEDMFAQLVKGGAVEEEGPDLDEEDYDSDDTIKAGERDITGSNYLAEMAQYKVSKTPQDDTDSLVGGLETESMTSTASKAHTHLTSKQRRRRRDKLGGAYSEAGTDFSMTSSANFRNSGLTTLDDRFDKVSPQIITAVSDGRFWKSTIRVMRKRVSLQRPWHRNRSRRTALISIRLWTSF
jgi:protein LTV1